MIIFSYTRYYSLNLFYIFKYVYLIKLSISWNIIRFLSLLICRNLYFAYRRSMGLTNSIRIYRHIDMLRTTPIIA